MTRMLADGGIIRLLGFRRRARGEARASETTARQGVPGRDHLVGREVRLKLNPWAVRGPKRGVFLGQGERGLSIRAPGGGQYVYAHHEVEDVTPT